MTINITTNIFDITANKAAFPLSGSIDPATLPAKATIQGVPAAPVVAMRFHLEYLPPNAPPDAGPTILIDHLEGGKTSNLNKFFLNGDNVPVDLTKLGNYTLTLSIYDNEAGNSPPIQPPQIVGFIVAIPPVLTKYPTKGVDGATLVTMTTAAIEQQGLQAFRGWWGQPGDFSTQNPLSDDYLKTLDYYAANRPGHACVLTLGASPFTLPTAPNILKMAQTIVTSLQPHVAKHGWNSVTVQIGNEIENPNKQYYTYPLPVPHGYTDWQWAITSFLNNVQNPLAKALKQLTNNAIRLAGFSFTGQPDYIPYALKAGYALHVDFCDFHCYASFSHDWRDAIVRCVGYLNGMKMIMSEWGARNGPNGVGTASQAKMIEDFIAAGCPGFESLVGQFYYKAPLTHGKNDPGFWDGTKLVEPIATAIKGIPQG